jgi:hypothetical protein
MPHRAMAETFEAIGDDLLDEFDALTREAHATYRSYDPAVLIEHDARAQANCTYTHMVAAADRRFLDRVGIRPLDIRGLKLWLFEHASVVVRFKKMDEDGRSRNYPTKQAKAFDGQLELPGLPPKPLRLTVGYLLDVTGVDFIRAQIARPDGRDALWCGAVIPREDRVAGERIWIDVTRQRRFA